MDFKEPKQKRLVQRNKLLFNKRTAWFLFITVSHKLAAFLTIRRRCKNYFENCQSDINVTYSNLKICIKLDQYSQRANSDFGERNTAQILAHNSYLREGNFIIYSCQNNRQVAMELLIKRSNHSITPATATFLIAATIKRCEIAC